MNEKILFVDDDANLLASVQRNLHRQFQLETAIGGEAALAKMAESGPFAVVISDRQMPGMDGIQFLSLARERTPDTVRVMLTGNVDLEQAIRAVNEGNIFRFLIKPCPTDLLAKTVENALTQYRLVNAEKELLEKTLSGSVKLLTEILAMVDAKSFGQAEQLCALITRFAEKTPLPEIWEIHLAAMLSPIGYITLPPPTAVKARAGSPLTKNEQDLVEAVPEKTGLLLANIPRLEGVARIARYQNKRFNGGGYPRDAIVGEAIPPGSRLIKILNDLLQLQARGITQHQALEEMAARQGWYDPELFASVSAQFGVLNEKPHAAMQTISIEANNLTVGMQLTSDIYTLDDTLILSSGHHITGMILERIQNFKLIYGIREPIFVRLPKF